MGITVLSSRPLLGIALCSAEVRAPWMRAVIRIQPGEGAGRDALGQTLHVQWRLPTNPRVWDRSSLYPSDRIQQPFLLECDAGSYVLPVGANLSLIGGIGAWDCTVETVVAFEIAPLDAWLTTLGPPGAPIVRPENHAWVRPVGGALKAEGITVFPTSVEPISLSCLSIVNASIDNPVLYRTGGAV